MENKEEMLDVAMNIIAFSGEARSNFMLALDLLKENNFEEANECINKGKEKLVKAHTYQTKLIQKECSGENLNTSILIIHAQDHLMSTIVIKDLLKTFIDLYKKIEK